jgi:hypothetical protein
MDPLLLASFDSEIVATAATGMATPPRVTAKVYDVIIKTYVTCYECDVTSLCYVMFST